MTNSDQPLARLRSATEFPKTIEKLSRSEANSLYEEMRACLIFTNRSRAQLLRRNEEHKQSALKLKTDVGRLQVFINQLKLEKQQLAEGNQLIISELEREVQTMTKHLDQLSDAFNTVADLDDPAQTQWNFLALPSRFFKFIQAVRAIVLFWREERQEDAGDTQFVSTSRPQLSGEAEISDDRRERPQMYTDPASQGRSLLDD